MLRIIAVLLLAVASPALALAQRQSDLKSDSVVHSAVVDSAKAPSEVKPPPHHRFDVCHSISQVRCTIAGAVALGLIGSVIGAQTGPDRVEESYTVGLLDGGSPLGGNTHTRCIKNCSVPALTYVLGLSGAAIGGYIGWKLGEH